MSANFSDELPELMTRIVGAMTSNDRWRATLRPRKVKENRSLGSGRLFLIHLSPQAGRGADLTALTVRVPSRFRVDTSALMLSYVRGRGDRKWCPRNLAS